MGNIFAFLSKYHRVFLFFLLEFICLYLVVNYNKNQKASFFSWTYEASGRIYKVYNNVNYYFHLKESNDSLLAENARLHQQQLYTKYVDTGKAQAINDTIHRQKYVYIPGRVVNNSITSPDNFITLDIGTTHHVDRHMGVVTTAGIVGITRDISPHFTSVLSVLHKDFTVSGEIAELNEIGSVVWDGRNPEILLLKNIPIHVRIKKGMHVVTSPYSNIFPEGSTIGTIQNFEVKQGEVFYTIYVKLAANMRNIRQVYVISNLMKDEQTKVEETSQNN